MASQKFIDFLKSQTIEEIAGAMIELQETVDRLKAVQQEPVKYEFRLPDGAWHTFVDKAHYEEAVKAASLPVRALYTSPPPAQPKAGFPAPEPEVIKPCGHRKYSFDTDDLGCLSCWAIEEMRYLEGNRPPAAPQPARQEPVASDFEKWLGQPSYHDGFGRSPDLWSLKQIQAAVAAMLAAAPQPAQPQEHVGEWGDGRSEAKRILWKPGYVVSAKVGDKLYTAPPASKPLTDEQILDEASHFGFLGSREQLLKFTRAIEAKLKEKNT